MADDTFVVWGKFLDSYGDEQMAFSLPQTLDEAKQKAEWYKRHYNLLGYTIHKNGIRVEQWGDMK